MKKRLTDARAPEEMADSARTTRFARWRDFFIHRHFAWLWTGQTISNFGSQITSLGLPVIALLLLHATPMQMGLLAALGTLPGLFLGLFVGVWVDRWPRRPILLLADLGRALLLLTIPLMTFLGLLDLAWLSLVLVLTGSLAVCFDIASLAFLPTLLAPEFLPSGNSRLSSSTALAEVTGPALAGLLMQWLSVPGAILLDVLSFLFSAFCLSRLHVQESSRVTARQQVHLWREIRVGLSALLRHPLLRTMALYACTRNFFGGAFAALYLLYVVQLFGSHPLTVGILVASGGIGALCGSFCASWCAHRLGLGRVFICSALLSGLLSLGTPLAVGSPPMVFAFLAFSHLVGDLGFAVYAINEISLRQILVPDHLSGRVNSCMHILSTGIVALGALLAGFLSSFIGVRLTLLVGAIGICLACVWLIFSPLRSHK